MSQLPVKGQKPVITQGKTHSLQKAAPQPLQQKVKNQVGFSQEAVAPAVRPVFQGGVTEYKDLNEKKNSYIIHSLYAVLAVLVGAAGYLYAMKVKPAQVEVVEKVVEKTVERVEYVERPASAPVQTYVKIEVDTNVPIVAKKPERNRFEDDFKKEEIRRKYQKINTELWQQRKQERSAYLSNRNHGAMDWAYAQIDHKYDDLEARVKEKEYKEICEATDSAFWCDYAAKYTTALKNKRLPAAETYPTYRSKNVTGGSESTPIYPGSSNAPVDNGIDFVGKPVEEI